jgi:hypothetical protein
MDFQWIPKWGHRSTEGPRSVIVTFTWASVSKSWTNTLVPRGRVR